MPRISLRVVSLIVAALTGCVAYQPKPLDPAVMRARLDGRLLDDEGLRRFL